MVMVEWCWRGGVAFGNGNQHKLTYYYTHGTCYWGWKLVPEGLAEGTSHLVSWCTPIKGNQEWDSLDAFWEHHVAITLTNSTIRSQFFRMHLCISNLKKTKSNTGSYMSVMPQLISIDSDLHEDTASSVIIFVKDIVRPSLKNLWHVSLCVSIPRLQGEIVTVCIISQIQCSRTFILTVLTELHSTCKGRCCAQEGPLTRHQEEQGSPILWQF